LRVAIISDIHGNFHALREVGKKIEEEGISRIWCLGDIVGYGPFPNECIEWVREKCEIALLGNHELALLGLYDLTLLNDYAASSILWTKDRLKPENEEFLKKLGVQALTELCQLVHDTPESPGSVKYILTKEDAYQALLRQVRPICFFGHTHIPVGYRLWGPEVDRVSLFPLLYRGGRYLINPGSVGQPRDRDPRASFGIFDLEDKKFNLVRVEYDVKAAAREILRVGLPEYLAARLLLGV
jgi:diadenosine tetraphosphatase ApaH/serine/threonine PP2A family protein phosphatase